MRRAPLLYRASLEEMELVKPAQVTREDVPGSAGDADGCQTSLECARRARPWSRGYPVATIMGLRDGKDAFAVSVGRDVVSKK